MATGTVYVAGEYAYVETMVVDSKVPFVGTYVESSIIDNKVEFAGLYVEEDWDAGATIISMNSINEIIFGSLIVR